MNNKNKVTVKRSAQWDDLGGNVTNAEQQLRDFVGRLSPEEAAQVKELYQKQYKEFIGNQGFGNLNYQDMVVTKVPRVVHGFDKVVATVALSLANFFRKIKKLVARR